MILKQLANAVMGDQEIPPPEKSQQRAPGDRENVVARQPAPDGLQLENAFQRRGTGKIGAVDGADAGADHHVGGNAVGNQRVQHAHLDGTKAATACEDKRSLRRIVLNRRGQGSPPEPDASPDERASFWQTIAKASLARIIKSRCARDTCWIAGRE